ncbi:hypothetical protein [Couchioplanes caeruleus]|uniref:Uncharacterized protein n=2 Tax=Couchioplanes caeruleus TaxID=56438 RepID=A0A1K0GR30_9ACTN|nr:hypothetical protein [Couchioplanes caeruleus]OJF14862.1 hypothetical protein BG844_07515 [Couchioplanes caeruleus subsp. caeruleus]ROP32158.1 hypothetical protein EDD30_5089 [Couchioplanes caeruleus]
MSKLLIGSLIVAIASTGALVITSIVGFPDRPGPPPGIPGVPPGPPPNVRSIAVLVVLTGIFVLAWLAVLVACTRDQILRRLGVDAGAPAGPEQIKEMLIEVRAQLAADRDREWQVVLERLAEYGEQRETDGYLNAMRAASGDQQTEANVRALRRPPTPR